MQNGQVLVTLEWQCVGDRDLIKKDYFTKVLHHCRTIIPKNLAFAWQILPEMTFSRNCTVNGTASCLYMKSHDLSQSSSNLTTRGACLSPLGMMRWVHSVVMTIFASLCDNHGNFPSCSITSQLDQAISFWMSYWRAELDSKTRYKSHSSVRRATVLASEPCFWILTIHWGQWIWHFTASAHISGHSDLYLAGNTSLLKGT